MTKYYLTLCAAALLGASSLASQTNIGQYSYDGTRVKVATDRGLLSVTPLTDDIFQVYVLPEGEPVPASKASVLSPGAENVKTSVSTFQDNVIISSPSTRVIINRKTGLVSFYDDKGNLIIAEAEGLDNTKDTKTVTFFSEVGENFYGAGERGHKLRLNGDTLVMFNRQNYGYGAGDPRISQMNITVPWVISDKGYGVLFDDHNASRLILGDSIKYVTENPASPLGYYLVNGKGTLAGATENYTRLTGRQGLPPFWSMGYITSKYGYKTQAETLGVVDTLKSKGYPVDGIVLDLYWYGKETDMGRLEWNKEQWPDHRGMLDSLRRQGVKLVAISQPYINKIGAIDNYNQLNGLGMLTKDAEGNTNDVTTWVGEAGMFDVSNPDTRAWLADRYYALTEDGIEGWWGDLGEPEVHPLTIVHNNGQTAAQYHNQYGNDWSRIIFDMWQEKYPNRRLMTLMRGGTAGLQRYNVFPWSTDVSRSWAGLQPQVNIMLNSGLSGLGYMSSDIGGFAVDPKHPTDEELYVRWLQMGTFTPTLRTHAQEKPEPYHYPKSEPISKRFIKMRYEWLPYNYTLAYENAAKGWPMVRPLDFMDPEANGRYATISDEYLWGNEVLIAPVMTKGARSRKVTFPAGSTWVDWNNPRLTYKGGSTATVAAPLNTLPMFVRQGSFIPQYVLPIENTDQYDPQILTVKYFPSATEKSTYTMYEDDRKSADALSSGHYQLITFTGEREGAQTKISMSAEGVYPGEPQVRLITVEVQNVLKAPAKVSASNGMRMPRAESLKQIRQSGWCYDAATRVLSMRITFDGSALTLTY